MIEIICAGVSGFSIGVYFTIRYNNFLAKKKNDARNLKDKETFNKIFEDYSLLKFTKRVNNYVYLSKGDIEILLDLKKNMIYLSSLDKFITDSRYLDENYNNKLINEINTYFYNEINDVVSIGDYIISKNLANISFEPDTNQNDNNDDHNYEYEYEIGFIEEKLNVDLILDKINSLGISSLTEEEINFLKKQGE